MKNNILCSVFLLLTFFVSCSDKKQEKTSEVSEAVEEVMTNLPFTAIDLKDMSAFQSVSENWSLAGNVHSDRTKDKEMTPYQGTGVLVNIPEEGKNKNIHSTFEHGDIELELDVLVPKGSNSGIYFQSRYEVQLYDSWGVNEPGYIDMGGIYQRWDATRGKGKEGYEGSAPITNTAKAPGLWQHVKIIFHAPKFDNSGAKTQNASFEEVWLNGVLIQENVDLTGATKGGAEEEVSAAPLMIQGDHGPVAIKNIRYKLYDNMIITFRDLDLKVFDSPSQAIPNLDSLEVLYTRKTDSISPVTVVDRTGQTILEYTGTMAIPTDGDYLFEMKVDGGAAFLIDNDTVVGLNGDYRMDSLGLGKIALEKGTIPFKLLYNKHTPWRRGFEFYVEGPGMQRYSIQEPSALASDPIGTTNFVINATDELVTQRSFWMHEGQKRTHCISVGMPQGTHFTYDLEAGSLLQMWAGDFMDATQMWLSRGEKQLGAPRGFVVSMHGEPEFAILENDEMLWPDNVTANPDYKQLGYEFDSKGVPVFSNRTGETTVTNKFIPEENQRSMRRMITLDGGSTIWHKIADGESIEKLPDGSFIVNDESYFVDFSGNGSIEPIIRSSNGKDELVLKIPSGKQSIEYNIIW